MSDPKMLCQIDTQVDLIVITKDCRELLSINTVGKCVDTILF